MKIIGFVLSGSALVLLSGCIQSHRTPSAVYITPPPVVATPAPVAPTSDRDAVRVYPSTPATVTVPSSAPPGVLASDVAVADSVSQLLKSNTSMADATGNVQVTVENGVVTLRGSVPTNHDRDEIVQRVAQLPGVVRVRDQLGVNLR